jgi:ribosome recycling factor
MEEFIRELRNKMAKAMEVTQNDLSSIRSGRATPSLVENIRISAYGGTQVMKLMEMATITTSDAKTILIQPYDPSVIHEISKGILEANVGLNPAVDGEVIRIPLPPLSEERRQEYIRLVKTKIEAGRVMVRQIRHDSMAQIRKDSLEKIITEDDKHLYEKKVQEVTDEIINSLDILCRKKEDDLMQI